MRTHPWDLESPQKTLAAIAEHSDLDVGYVVVAAVDVADNTVRGVREVEEPDDDLALLAARLGDAAHELVGAEDVGRDEPPVTVLVTLVCRGGRATGTLRDHRVARAWLLSNHGLRVLHGDVFVVTPHGWCSLDHDDAGVTPRTRLEPAGPRPGIRPSLYLVAPPRAGAARLGRVRLVQ